jgi:hypothetical protein
MFFPKAEASIILARLEAAAAVVLPKATGTPKLLSFAGADKADEDFARVTIEAGPANLYKITVKASSMEGSCRILTGVKTGEVVIATYHGLMGERIDVTLHLADKRLVMSLRQNAHKPTRHFELGAQ